MVTTYAINKKEIEAILINHFRREGGGFDKMEVQWTLTGELEEPGMVAVSAQISVEEGN